MKSIFHPYRGAAPASHRPASVPIEELIFYAALCLVGAIPIWTTAARGGAFGVEATIGVLMIAAGIVGLVSSAFTAAGPLSPARTRSASSQLTDLPK
jgi:hypothetical protein